MIDRGRACTRATRHPPRVTAEGIVGGVLAVLQTRLVDQQEQRLSELLGPLMSLIVLPYLGGRAARSELARPAPVPADRPARQPLPVRGDPLHGLNMRLTHRTMRVLAAIAEQPGASNREIAEHAEIVDQGQISKLLTRLSDRGLIRNFGAGQQRGAPNAWQLTPRGAQLEQASRRR